MFVIYNDTPRLAERAAEADPNVAKLGKYVAELRARRDPRAEAIMRDLEDRVRSGYLSGDIVSRVGDYAAFIGDAIGIANSVRRFR